MLWCDFAANSRLLCSAVHCSVRLICEQPRSVFKIYTYINKWKVNLKKSLLTAYTSSRQGMRGVRASPSLPVDAPAAFVPVSWVASQSLAGCCRPTATHLYGTGYVYIEIYIYKRWKMWKKLRALGADENVKLEGPAVPVPIPVPVPVPVTAAPPAPAVI